jgi:hypothetical protein
MSGALNLEGTDLFFEGFLFAKSEEKAAKVENLVEHAVFGPLSAKGGMGGEVG